MSEARTIGEIVDRLPDPPRSPAVTPMQMLQLAVEKGATLEMMERLMTLQERWEAGEARKAFVTALSAFKANPPTVVKNKAANFGSNKSGGATQYEYVTLDRVCDVIGAGLSKHQLSHRWEVDQKDAGIIRVTCILQHVGGHSERVTMQAGADTSGSKNAIQAIGSATTYLERYTLLAATGLAARSQDDDAHINDGDTISAAQKEELIALMKETNTDTKKYLDYLGVGSLDEILSIGFANAKAALEQKRQKVKAP